MNKILIMGLPGSGKTYLAMALKKYLETYSNIRHLPTNKMINMEMAPSNYHCTVDWFNADDIRKRYNDWDFSKEGRIRQSLRMAEFAFKASGDYVICDFVAPLVEMRNNFKADWTVWMDTIDQGRFNDTNKAFVPPEQYDFRVIEQNADKLFSLAVELTLSPTVLIFLMNERCLLSSQHPDKHIDVLLKTPAPA